MIALLAPEFVVFNAWSQRRQAVRIARMLRRRCGQEDPCSCASILWAYFWPRSPIIDQESLKCQGKQRAGHISDLRSQNLAQGDPSHSAQGTLPESELQEQEKALEVRS